MKLEDLLQFDITQAEKLSDEERIALCKPYWPITRPDPAKYKADPNAKTPSKAASAAKKQELNKMQLGLKIMEQYKHLLK